MRVLVVVAAIGLLGCGGSGGATPVTDGAASSDRVTEQWDAREENVGDGDAGPDSGAFDGHGDAPEASGDASDPFLCDTLTPLVLSGPTVMSRTVAAGQTAMLEITLTDNDPNGYISYPGVILTSPTVGITIPYSNLGTPGSYIDGRASKQIVFTVSFDAAIPPKTAADFSARVYGWGHVAPDCPNAFVLSFSLTVD